MNILLESTIPPSLPLPVDKVIPPQPCPAPQDGAVSEKQLNEIHSFSRKLAKDYRVNGAILLAFLDNRIQTIQHQRKDKRGYFTSISKLAERYPYLSPSTIGDTLAKLRKQGVIKGENHNKYKYDRKLWYSFAKPEVQKDAAGDPIRFKVADAVAFGVVGAVLLANLTYWIKEHRLETPDYTWHRISASTLTKHLPFSSRTICRALNTLVEGGAVERRACSGFDHAFQYRLLDESRLHSVESATDASTSEMHAPNPEVDAPFSEMDTPNPEMHKPKSEMDAPNPDDYNTLEDSVGKTSLGSSYSKDHVGKNTFITPSATPPESCGCFYSNSAIIETRQNEVTNSLHLPIQAEGGHSKVEAPMKEVGQETALSGLSESEKVAYVRSHLRRPAANSLVSGTVASVSRAPMSESQKDVPTPSSNKPTINTKLPEELTISPFVQIPPSMSSGLTPEQLTKKLAEIKRQRKMEDQAKIQPEKKLKEIKERQMVMYQQLFERYASPYQKKENVKSLSAEEKVRVLKAGLRSRLKTGSWSLEKNEHYTVAPVFTKGGLEMASKFFKLNPTVTVSDLLGMVDMCCEIDYLYPKPDGGFDEQFYERRGKNLSYLLKHLATINAQLNLCLLPVDIVYLDDDNSELTEVEILHNAEKSTVPKIRLANEDIPQKLTV